MSSQLSLAFHCPSAARSVPGCADVAVEQDCLDDTTQAAYRAAAPVCGNGSAFDAIERGHPTGIETAFLREICNHSRQECVEIVRGRLRKDHDPKAITD